MTLYKRGETEEINEAQELLLRHPEYDRETLERLQVEREKARGQN
jgi:hypothetical protein